MSRHITLLSGLLSRVGLLRVRAATKRPIWMRVTLLIVLSLLAQSSAQAIAPSVMPAAQAFDPALKAIGYSPKYAAVDSNIVYVCSTSNIGRTNDISVQSPVWTNITPPDVGTLNDCVPDPLKPQEKMWAVSTNGIWKGQNLNTTTPLWTLLRTTDQIRSDTDGFTQNGSADRIIPSIGIPGMVFVLYSHGGLGSAPKTWVGRSTDDGLTWFWSKVADQGEQARDFGFAILQKVSSPDAVTIWATAKRGHLYTSTDGGKTFSQNQQLPPSNFYQLHTIYAPVADTDGLILYVADGSGTGGAAYIYRTLDGGDTWTNIAPVGGDSQPRGPLRQYEITGPPSSSAHLYALVQRPQDVVGENKKLYYSADGGALWTLRYDFGAWPFDVLGIGLNPIDENLLYVLRQDLNGAVSSTLIFSSNDGGTTWSDKSGNWKANVGDWTGAIAIWDTSVPSCTSNPQNPDADSDGDGLKDNIELQQTRIRPDGTIVTLDPCHPDTDGDGLLDPWEVDPTVPGAGFDLNGDGIRDVSRDAVFSPYRGQTVGSVTSDLRFSGSLSLVGKPDPFHKDVYLEIDWEDCKLRGCPRQLTIGNIIFTLPFDIDPTHHAPNIVGLNDAIDAFRQAPVQNPDSRSGIRLHILVDEALKHMPICDQGESSLRRTRFGTVYQRTSSDIIKAKSLAFRYVATIHSTISDDIPNLCPVPFLNDFLPTGLGLKSLPYYDHSPFGDANVGGNDILVSLGPLWICPHQNLLLGFIPVCFRGVTKVWVPVPNPLPPHFPPFIPIPTSNLGIFPAMIEGQTQTFNWPIHMLLGVPSEQGMRQLWGRVLVHLLGHSLGLEDDAVVLNKPDVPGFRRPELYANWVNLRYAPISSSVRHPESSPNYGQLVAQDLDLDTVIEGEDNCPGIPNSKQNDLDSDGYGDDCDPDRDNDGLPNQIDVVPPIGGARNSFGLTDMVDPFPSDTDNDGIDNSLDNDDDGDGVLDTADNCVLLDNSEQLDTDGDGIGDECDFDEDNDSIPDMIEQFVGSGSLNPDSQPEFVGSYNVCADGLDNDLDENVDGNDEGCVDTDNDTAPDFIDNCPLLPNDVFENHDGDDLGDDCDPDDDDDTITDEVDLCPDTPIGALADANGCSDGEVDADGDGILNPFALSVGPSGAVGFDNCPVVFNPDQADSDGNGIGDVCEESVPARLIIIKHVVNDNGGTAAAADFTMSVTGTNVNPTSFPGDENGTTLTLDAGDYSVSESGLSGYAMSFSADCSGTITAGESKTCTFTDDDIPPRLIVIKHVVNNSGGTATAADFTMNVSGTNVSPASFPGNENGTTVTLDTGSYSVSESGPSGYTASFSTDCAGTVAVGEPTRICTITNEDLQSVDIDIVPHSKQNRIHFHRKHGPIGLFQVAILSTSDFNAPSVVDRTSLTFGHTGDEESLKSCPDNARDVNRDGLKDLICIFRGSLTGLQVGDTTGILKGTTVDGARIEGSDSVKIVISGEHEEEEDE